MLLTPPLLSPPAMVELDGDDIRISSRGKVAERDIVQVTSPPHTTRGVWGHTPPLPRQPGLVGHPRHPKSALSLLGSTDWSQYGRMMRWTEQCEGHQDMGGTQGCTGMWGALGHLGDVLGYGEGARCTGTWKVGLHWEKGVHWGLGCICMWGCTGTWG